VADLSPSYLTTFFMSSLPLTSVLTQTCHNHNNLTTNNRTGTHNHADKNNNITTVANKRAGVRNNNLHPFPRFETTSSSISNNNLHPFPRFAMINAPGVDVS